MVVCLVIFFMQQVCLCPKKVEKHWSKPQSLRLADQKVGGSNPRDRVSSCCSVPAPAHLAVQKHVRVQVDKVDK